MHFTLLRLPLGLFLGLLLTSLNALADTGRLYQASGMAQHQEHFQAALAKAQQQYGAQLPPAVRDTLQRNSSQRFELRGMHDRAQTRLALELDEGHMRQALEFFDSPLGRKIVQIETNASSPASVAAMQGGLPVMQLSPERRALIDRLASQLPALEMGVEVSTALTGLAAQSANDLLGGLLGTAQAASDGGASVSVSRCARNAQYLAYIYRDLSDAELTRFADWSESAAGRAFYRATERAVQDALNP